MIDDIYAKSSARVAIVPPGLTGKAFRNVRALFDDSVAFVESNVEDSKLHMEPLEEVLVGRYAYGIFTSGSTGKPKGVLQGQRGLMAMIRQYQKSNDISEDSVSLQLTSFTWDIHGQELWAFLLVRTILSTRLCTRLCTCLPPCLYTC